MFAPLAEAFERGRGQSVDNRPPRFSPPPSISSALSSNGPFLSQLTRPTYHVFPIAPHTFPSKGLEQYSHCHCIVHNPEEGGVRYHVFTHSSPVSHPLRLPPWQLQFNGDKPAPTDSQSISSLFHLCYQNHHFQCVSLCQLQGEEPGENSSPFKIRVSADEYHVDNDEAWMTLSWATAVLSTWPQVYSFTAARFLHFYSASLDRCLLSIFLLAPDFQDFNWIFFLDKRRRWTMVTNKCCLFSVHSIIHSIVEMQKHLPPVPLYSRVSNIFICI